MRTLAGVLRGTIGCSPRRAAVAIEARRLTDGILVRMRSRKVNVPTRRLRGVCREFCQKEGTGRRMGSKTNINLCLTEGVVRRRKKAVTTGEGTRGNVVFGIALPLVVKR